MAIASMEDYQEIMDTHPEKFDQNMARYRLAKLSEPRCDGCIHFFTRVTDNYHVCEIVRPVPDRGILPEWTCKFQTADGKEFPLYGPS
jgi:hypothetical protein